MTDFTIMDVVRVPDGREGVVTAWSDADHDLVGGKSMSAKVRFDGGQWGYFNRNQLTKVERSGEAAQTNLQRI